MTDPLKTDSDRDGITDSEDLNPRYSNKENKFSVLYSKLLEFGGIRDSCYIDYENPDYHSGGEADTNFLAKYFQTIITSDSRLKHISPKINTYIILTNKEYDEYLKKNIVTPERIYVSPLERVKNKPNYYKITIDVGFWGNDYLIYEGEHGWTIKLTGGYII